MITPPFLKSYLHKVNANKHFTVLSADVSCCFVMLFPMHVERVCLSQVCIVYVECMVAFNGGLVFVGCLSIDRMSWFLSVMILVGNIIRMLIYL